MTVKSTLLNAASNPRLRRGAGIALTVAGATLLSATPAYAAGLDQAQGFLEQLKSQLTTIIPIVAVISMLVLGVMYANGMVRKETLVHWFIGVILAGSATELVALFFTGS
jgi:type IV secretory pathway VirB2 component (pilin)